jgi:colanic acid biosynthesis glycosyl transferase WcaI
MTARLLSVSDELGSTNDGQPDPLDILIFSSYYWPETAGNAPYVTGVAEYLASRGHRVMVATGFPHYPEWRSSGRGVLGVQELHRGVEIRRRRHYVPGTQSALTRAAYEASLCALGTTAFPRRAPDAIIGISPTLTGAVLARAAASLYRRPYGLVFQDLQGPGALQSGIEGGRRIAAFVGRLEIRLARQAAAVGVIAEGFRGYFEDHGIPTESIHDLRNWSQDAVATETMEETRSRLGWSKTDFVCLHAGNMGRKQGLENVLHAAAEIADPNIRIVLAGDGNERARLEMLAEDLRLANVSFLPPQPTGLYESMLRAADVLLVNQRPSVAEMALASKLTSYFMAERPVIGAVAERSETARELGRAGAGLLATPDDPLALAEAIRRLRADVDKGAELGAQGRRYAERHLSATTVLESYETFVRTIHSRVTDTKRTGLTGRPWHATDPRPTLIDASTQGLRTEHAVVSVLIVSFKCWPVLESCLVSIENEGSALPLEVIVVDNASQDDTVASVAERFPWVRIIANHDNVGFAHAANEAMQIAQGEYFLILNPDTLLPHGSLSASVAELERHPDVGMLGCKLVRPDGSFDHACKRGFPTVSSALYFFFGLSRLRPSSPRFAHYTAGPLDKDDTGPVDAVNGAFMLVRRGAVDEVGAMDERYWLYAEDLDWCRRFWETGWKILYWPGVEVVHTKGGSAGEYRSWILNRAFHRSMWLFYAKHHAPDQPRLVAGAVWAGVWAKLAMSVLASSIRRRPGSQRHEPGAPRSVPKPDAHG